MKFLTLIFLLVIGNILFSQSELRFEKYDIRAGLSQTIINCVEQDKKGFLWIGTQDGLNRFDGYNFKVYKPDPFDANSIIDNYINFVHADDDNNLWIGTEYGMSVYIQETDSFLHIKHDPGIETSISDNEINHIFQTSNGDVWVSTQNGGLNLLTAENAKKKNFEFKRFHELKSGRVLNQTFRVFEWNGQILISSDGALFVYDDIQDKILPMLQNHEEFFLLVNNFSDVQGKLWLSTSEGAMEAQVIGRQIRIIGQIDKRHGLKDDMVYDVYGHDDFFWIGSEEGLTKIEFNGLDTVGVPVLNEVISNYNSGSTKVSNFLLDDFGSLWIGTDRGLNRFDENKSQFKLYRNDVNDKYSLIDNTIWAFTSVDENVIIGTQRGISILDKRRKRFKNLTIYNSNIPAGAITALYTDSKKRVWVSGKKDGVKIMTKSGKNIRFIPVQHLLPDELDGDLSVFTFLEDSKGRFWIGGREGISLLSRDFNIIERFLPTEDEYSLPHKVIRHIYEDSKGNIWVGTDGGGLCRVIEQGSDISFEVFNYSYLNKQGPNNPMVLSIMEDVQGDIWFATYGGGVNKYSVEEKRFYHFTEKDGLSNNVVYGIVRDKKGNIWVSTNKGLSQINPRDNTIRVFTEKSGLQSDEFNIGAFYRSPSGEIYFGGINGFNSFYPQDIRRNTMPPRLAFTKISVFNEPLDLAKYRVFDDVGTEQYYIELDHKQNTLNFDFVGLHFASPEDNWYKFRLEGIPDEWTMAKNRRFASYSNLSYGDYTFKITSSNSDRTWNKNYAEVQISIAPPYYHTWWFRTLALVAGLGIFFGIYFSRLAIIKSQKRLLEQQVSLRTQKVLEQKKKIEIQRDLIEQEKYKAEQLLLNILPQETAEELIKTGKASPRHYRMVTVLFCDFKGFTRISEMLRPKDLVEELDYCFNAFDDIMDKYNLEKIKTSGDSYMAAGGVPIRNKTNPIDMILAAIEIQRFMLEHRAQRKKEGRPAWELRLGIHTGEVIAGVVGKKKFAYDIWGDTVNTAARMESSSEPGKINISGSTYQYVVDYFDCEYRGKVPAKNKGEVDMYYVTGIKKALSVSGLRAVPNIKFQELLNFNVYSKLNYNKVRKFLLKRLEQELPKNLHYHGAHHTRDVIRSAERIAVAEGLDEESVMLVKTAALFHDAGFLRKYWRNEPQGVELAREILPDYGYSIHQIDMIEGMIMATAIPQNPQNLFEEIMCDADLDYLGRDDFDEISDTLCQELIEYGKIRDAEEWDPIQVKFLEHHKYFTKTNIETRKTGKHKNLENVVKRVKQRKNNSTK